MKRRASSGTPGRSIVWTERALADLEQIGDFTAKEAPEAARRWVDGLSALAERAAANPLAGRCVPEIGYARIREGFKGTYLLIHRVADERIEVLTVFEGHRLLPKGVAE